MILILLMACEPLPTTVALSGTVLDAPDGEGSPVAGASVVTFDDALETVGEAVTDAAGAFEVDVPAGYAFFLHVDADARVPTAFSGTAGLTDFGAGDGYPWSADQAWVDAQRADFAGCGTAGDAGAIVAGEARVPLAGGASTPLVPDVTVEAIGADGVTRVACYLPVDDAGTAGVETGESGRFAVFGLPAGPALVSLNWTLDSGAYTITDYRFVLPEGGVVPLFPAYVYDGTR